MKFPYQTQSLENQSVLQATKMTTKSSFTQQKCSLHKKKCVIRPLQMLVDVAKPKEKSSSERLTLRDYGTNTAQIFKH